MRILQRWRTFNDSPKKLAAVLGSLALVSAGLGMLRELALILRLGFGPVNDTLNIYLSANVITSLAGEAMRGFWLRIGQQSVGLFPKIASTAFIIFAAFGSFFITMALMGDLSPVLAATSVAGGALYAWSAAISSIAQTRGRASSVGAITLLTNLISVAATVGIVLFLDLRFIVPLIVFLSLVAPALQTLFLNLILPPGIGTSTQATSLSHFTDLAGQTAYPTGAFIAQWILRIAAVGAGTGIVAAVSIGLRLARTTRAIIADSVVAAFINTWHSIPTESQSRGISWMVAGGSLLVGLMGILMTTAGIYWNIVLLVAIALPIVTVAELISRTKIAQTRTYLRDMRVLTMVAAISLIMVVPMYVTSLAPASIALIGSLAIWYLARPLAEFIALHAVTRRVTN